MNVRSLGLVEFQAILYIYIFLQKYTIKSHKLKIFTKYRIYKEIKLFLINYIHLL